MYAVELLDEAIQASEQAGYCVRQEWLGGQGGGPCELAGRRYVFVDLALTPAEQLEALLDALRDNPATERLALSPALQNLIRGRKAA
jgi:hypothetical protein